MTTAMQDMIEKIDYCLRNSDKSHKVVLAWLKFHANLLRKKEELQVVDTKRIKDHIPYKTTKWKQQTKRLEQLDIDQTLLFEDMVDELLTIAENSKQNTI